MERGEGPNKPVVKEVNACCFLLALVAKTEASRNGRQQVETAGASSNSTSRYSRSRKQERKEQAETSAAETVASRNGRNSLETARPETVASRNGRGGNRSK